MNPLKTICVSIWMFLVLLVTGCSADKPQLLAVTGVTPTALSAGAVDTVIKVTGQQFNRNMSVVVGPSAVPTRFVSSTELDATVPASLLVNGASLTIAIYDNEGAQGGGATLSTSFTLQVTNPVPMASSVSPNSFIAGQARAAVV